MKSIIKNLNLIKNVLLSVFFLTFFSSCFQDDDGYRGDPKSKKEVKLKDVLNALGGTAEISALTTLNYTVNGQAFEYEEEEPNQPNPIEVREYTYELVSELNNRKLRLDYADFNSKYPLVYSGQAAKIIVNNEQGSISGQYDVASYYFGVVTPTGLYANRIEALLKNYQMSNPIELIKEVVSSANNLNFKTSDLKYSIPTKITGLNIELFINNETLLPTKAIIQESDYLYGDTTFEVVYETWAESSSIMFPSTISYNFRENTIKTESISNVVINASLEADIFAVEEVANPIPYDLELGQKGIYFSQWYSRFFDASIAIDLPLTQALVAADAWIPFGIPDQTIGDNLKIIGRPDTLYWGIAVKTSDGVIFIDPNVSPEWSRAMINATQSAQGFPNEDIVGVVATHTHVDHFGGIRELAYESETVYINQTAKAEIEAVLSSSHTLVPDNLALNPKNIDIIEVDGVLQLDGGAVELHAVNMNNSGNNPHSENMILVYVPEYKAVIQADLFNAGGLLAIYAGATLFPMDDSTKAIFKERAQFLLNYINENELDVTTIIGAHGGVATLPQLQFVAQ